MNVETAHALLLGLTFEDDAIVVEGSHVAQSYRDTKYIYKFEPGVARTNVLSDLVV